MTFDFYLDAWKYAVRHRIAAKLIKKIKRFDEKHLCFQVVYQLPNVRGVK
jgi:hypothetical protein